MPLFAQERMQFKGIPMEGSVKNFADKLVTKKFTLVDKDETGLVVLQGSFAGMAGTYVIVLPVSESNSNIGSILALSEAGGNWNTITTHYHNIVELYTEKYGSPAFHIEKVDSSEGLEVYALANGDCEYVTIWEFDYGRIEVSLDNMDFPDSNENYVVIKYFDEESMKERRKEQLEDI